MACVAAQSVEFREELAIAQATPTASAGVLQWVREAAIPPDKTLYVPYYFVPALHLYHPELQTAGYDHDWPLNRLTAEIRSPEAHNIFLCVEPVCNQVEAALGGAGNARKLVAQSHDGYPLYAVATSRN
jgi:hypothetical protein